MRLKTMRAASYPESPGANDTPLSEFLNADIAGSETIVTLPFDCSIGFAGMHRPLWVATLPTESATAESGRISYR
jgi:hypothetical protein